MRDSEPSAQFGNLDVSKILRKDQLALHAWMERSAPPLAPVYLGAAHMVTNENFPGAVHFISHAMREIGNQLPPILVDSIDSSRLEYQPLVKTIRESWDEWQNGESESKSEVQRFLDSVLALLKEDAQVRSTIREKAIQMFQELGEGPPAANSVEHWLAATKDHHKLAHLRPGQLPDDALEQCVASFHLLEKILVVLSQPFYASVQELDEILHSPPEKEVKELKRFFLHASKKRYFFRSLDDPSWLKPLSEEGYFAKPPSMSGDGMPQWPEGEYLLKMVEVLPSEVAKIWSSVSEVENPIVVRISLQIFCHLPGDLIEKDIARKVFDLIGSPFPDFFFDQAAEAVLHLFKSGAKAQACSALKVILGWPIAKRNSGMVRDEIAQHPYHKLLETVIADPDVATDWLIFRCLVSLIEDQQSTMEPSYSKYSHAWLLAIADSQDDDSGYVPHQVSAINTLITGLASVALQVAAQDEKRLQDVFGYLRERSQVHNRIALHVLARSKGGIDLVEGVLVDPENLREELRSEFRDLLQRRFADVSEDIQEQFLMLIQEHVAEAGDLEGSYKRWWLDCIKDHLSGDHRKEFEQLEALHDSVESNESDRGGVYVAADESPFELEDLLEMPTSGIVETLRTWEPEPEQRGLTQVTVEGFAAVLRQLVEQKAKEISSECAQFENLDWVYVRNLYDGLVAGLRDGQAIAWPEVLRLSDVIIEQTQKLGPTIDEATTLERSLLRQSVASLLGAGVSTPNSPIQDADRRAAVEQLRALSKDQIRTDEDLYLHHDPLMPVINTTQGVALNAIINDAVRSKFEKVPDLEVIEEALSTLVVALEGQGRLEPAYAVVGNQLPRLVHLSPEWVSDNLGRLFPEDKPEQLEFAWNAYLRQHKPYSDVFTAVHRVYRSAVENLNREITTPTWDQANTRLGQHLVIFAIRGLDTDSLIESFFLNADDGLAAETMTHLGRCLRATEDLPDEIVRNTQELWNKRIETALEDIGSHQKELLAFTDTFVASKLSKEWEQSTLASVLESCEIALPPTSNEVVHKLADQANENPAASLRLLRLLLERSTDQWEFGSWKEGVLEIVSHNIETDPQAEENRAWILNKYLGKGYNEFKDLF